MHVLFLYSLATDIVDNRLEMAKKMGADVTINCKTQNLREAGIEGKKNILFVLICFIVHE